MKTFNVIFTQTIRVSLDETKFDDRFMKEFAEIFYPFDTLAEHAEHIAQLVGRGVVGEYELKKGDLIEGYGPATEFSLAAKVLDSDLTSEEEP